MTDVKDNVPAWLMGVGWGCESIGCVCEGVFPLCTTSSEAHYEKINHKAFRTTLPMFVFWFQQLLGTNWGTGFNLSVPLFYLCKRDGIAHLKN